MKLFKLAGTIAVAAMLALGPVHAAEQGSLVMPSAGPMSMATLINSWLNPGIRALASCNWGASAPANGPSSLPLAYQCWADTTSNPVLFKRYDGYSWVVFGALDTTAHSWTPYRQGAPIVAVATSGSAADLTAGTLPAARLPNPSATTLGGTQSKACATSNWLNAISTSGVPGCAQPSFSDLLSSIACSQLAALTGDVSTTAGSCATAIGANKVLDTMLRQGGALSLIGRSANTTGNVADIQATAGSSCAFRESSNTIGCGTLATAAYAANSVTNAKLAQMANGSSKCRTTAGTGDPEDCTATQMRSLLLLVVGTNVEAWDADLDALAALSSNGMIARTGAGTAAARTFTAPAAGITIGNGDGVAGNPTLALANDLAALEGLTGTGLARRTGTDAWSVGTVVSQAEGGTGQVTAAAARQSSGLNVYGDSGTAHGDAAAALACTERMAYTNAAFTASRTWTLPAANCSGASFTIKIADMQGTVTGVNTLVIARAGSDTINGSGTSVTITAANGGYECSSDGTSKWSCLSMGAASGGGVSSVTCGTGLSGGVITTSGTCAIVGSPVLLNTVTGSGVASLSDTTSLTATYPAYELVVENVFAATNNVTLNLQVQVSGTFQTTGYLGANVATGSGTVITNATGAVQISQTATVQNTGNGLSGTIRIITPSNTTAPKAIYGQSTHTNGTFYVSNAFSGAYTGGNAAVTGFQVVASSGNLTGTIKVYGIP
uniref:hypothetical protein n=1 Tax=Bradyrhizobium sp. (strain ORS 278) TaxID=114615 RepID=UPI0002FAFFAD|nr:hypothetical protein [Bradyrhizobium sp. ORS 278]